MINVATWFCQSDVISLEELATRRGFQPRCLEYGSTHRAYHSDHEHQLHCKG